MIYSTLALLLLSSNALGVNLRPGCSSKPVLISEFTPEHAGGVAGTIKATYANHWNPMEAKIQVDLDLSHLDIEAIKEKYPECEYPATKFGWHIHAKWNNEHESGFLADCSPAQTGGHYDPTFACGPASQYSKDVTCTSKSEFPYACSAETFENKGVNCEVGDFSGKFGAFELGESGKIKATYKDFFFPSKALYNQPMYLEPQVRWNFVLHLACPQHKNPRILCATANLRE